MTILNFITLFVIVLFSPTLLAPSTHLLLKNMQAGRHCFTSLSVNETSVLNEETKMFTFNYANFIQTTGIRDGDSYWAKILSVFYDNLHTSDPNDPEVIIKIDISNSFNSTCRVLTLDVLSGRVSRAYACGLKKGDPIPTFENLSNFLGYFKVMDSCHAKLRS